MHPSQKRLWKQSEKAGSRIWGQIRNTSPMCGKKLRLVNSEANLSGLGAPKPRHFDSDKTLASRRTLLTQFLLRPDVWGNRFG